MAAAEPDGAMVFCQPVNSKCRRSPAPLTGNPGLLLLDERSGGLAPFVVKTRRVEIGELTARGLTILLAEQGVDFALALADRLYVLEKGAVRFSAAAVTLPRRQEATTARSGWRSVSPAAGRQYFNGHAATQKPRGRQPTSGPPQ